MKRFKVNENMIMWSFRYALGRRTGAVTDVVETLKRIWKELEPFTQQQIREEIQNALRVNSAGDTCDIVQWQKILKLSIKTLKDI